MKEKNKLAKYIGSNIFQYRKKKKLTREELTEKSNLSSNHIYELEMVNCMPTTITLIEHDVALRQILLEFFQSVHQAQPIHM